jgi:hypothetical protein
VFKLCELSSLKGGTCVFYVACGEDGQETSVLYPPNFEIVYYKIISKEGMNEGMNEDVKICISVFALQRNRSRNTQSFVKKQFARTNHRKWLTILPVLQGMLLHM